MISKVAVMSKGRIIHDGNSGITSLIVFVVVSVKSSLSVTVRATV